MDGGINNTRIKVGNRRTRTARTAWQTGDSSFGTDAKAPVSVTV